LDTQRTYLDRGRSAFHGRHRQQGGALKAFLAEVERGDIPRGSVLLLENLDRLSRENHWDSVPLLCSIVNAGITVVSLTPTEMTFERGSDLTALILALVEFGRAHGESASKSGRVAAVWSQKREAARANGSVMTRKLPTWVQERDGKLSLIPDRAKVVRRIFELAVRGYGIRLIIRELEGVPTWSRSKVWRQGYVHSILTGRMVLGEFQPTSGGKPDGEPIADYYPAVVDESTWLQVQASLARRKDKPGPTGKAVAGLFSGLLHDAVTRDRLHISFQTRGTGRHRVRRRVLITGRGMEGAAPTQSFPHDVFEPAVLSLLKEVNPADVLGKEPESESVDVAKDLAIKEQRARQIEAELAGDDGDVPSLARVLRKLDEECVALRKRLADLRQKEANPRSMAWTEASTLLDVAESETSRIRLRELIRTMVEEIWVLIVPRRSHRFAAVQVFFAGGGRRDYLIHYQAAGYCRGGGWCACSLMGDIGPNDLDLRRDRDVRDLRTTLETADVASLVEAMGSQPRA
jgi:DNA invertase Pin-like site-specific DNA recombinase